MFIYYKNQLLNLRNQYYGYKNFFLIEKKALFDFFKDCLSKIYP